MRSKKDITIPPLLVVLAAPFFFIVWLVMKPSFFLVRKIKGIGAVETPDHGQTSFYFYLSPKHKEKAEELGAELKKQGFATNVHLLEGQSGKFDSTWSVTASKNGNEFEATEVHLRKLAKQYDAEYDGHEILVN